MISRYILGSLFEKKKNIQKSFSRKNLTPSNSIRQFSKKSKICRKRPKKLVVNLAISKYFLKFDK